MPTVFNGFASSAGALLAGETSGLGIDFLASLPTLYSESSNTLMNYYGTPFTNDGGKIDFSRASLATTTDVDGKIKWVPHNFIIGSEQFDLSNWVKSNVTVSASAAVAPNGYTTADTIVLGAGTAVKAIYQPNGAVNNGMIAGCFVKLSSGNARYLQILRNNDVNAYANFDIAGGAVGGKGSSAISSSIISFGSDWYYISASFTGSGDSLFIYVVDGASSGYSASTSATGSFNIWGAHLYRSDLGGMQANGSAYPYYNPTTAKNLLGYSEAFDNAAWGKTGTIVTSNAAAAPNGSLSADKIISNGSAGVEAYVEQSPALTNSPETISCYIKAAGWNYAALHVRDAVNGFTTVYFNLANGTVVSSGAGWSNTGIVSVGDGWYRCYGTKTRALSQAIVIAPSINGTSFTQAGDGVNGIFAWGAQLSASSSLDPYVPNFAAAPSAAAYYGPRIDYDAVNLGSSKGLLIEEQRTNLLLRASEINNAVWVKAGSPVAVVSPDDAIGPDGTLTADKVSQGSGDGYVFQSVTGSINTTYTFSVYLKPDVASRVMLYIGGGGVGGADGGIRFNAFTGAFVSSAGTAPSSYSSNVLSNGWIRFSVTFTTGASDNTFDCTVMFLDASNARTNQSGWVYGAQLEAGSFATSYIPTAASTVTRSADVASVGVSQFSYSATSGTVVIEATACDATAASSGGVSPQSVALYADTNNELYLYRAASSNLTGLYGATSGSPVVNSTTTAWPNGATRKAGFAYAVDDFSLVFAGGTPVTDTAGTPATATQLNIGRRGNNAGFWNGYIRQITYLPRRLTNTELQAKTSA